MHFEFAVHDELAVPGLPSFVNEPSAILTNEDEAIFPRLAELAGLIGRHR